MAKRKQRRRRAKERRHEYEYVYIDEEGREVEVEPVAAKKQAEKGNGAKSGAAARPRGMRPVQPPNWRSIRRQWLIFVVVFFVLLMILPMKKSSVEVRLGIALFYGLMMLPFIWLIERAKYRSYLKRTGRLPERKRDAK